MAEQNSIPAQPGIDHPSRRLIAAGIRRGSGPLVVEPPQSENDRLAHEKASHVRRPAVVEQPVLPPLPAAGTPARRRAVALRGW